MLPGGFGNSHMCVFVVMGRAFQNSFCFWQNFYWNIYIFSNRTASLKFARNFCQNLPSEFFGGNTYIYIYIYIGIYIYNTAVLIKIYRFFLINVVKFIYAYHYEIGPSNVSQWQHGRKDATE